MKRLTDRQVHILRQLDSGMSVPEIANATLMNIATIRGHVNRLMKKTRCHTVFQLGGWLARNPQAIAISTIAKVPATSDEKTNRVTA